MSSPYSGRTTISLTNEADVSKFKRKTFYSNIRTGVLSSSNNNTCNCNQSTRLRSTKFCIGSIVRRNMDVMTSNSHLASNILTDIEMEFMVRKLMASLSMRISYV